MKLVKAEAESNALHDTLRGSEIRYSSELAAIEVTRRARIRGAAAELQARRVLGATSLRAIDRDVVERAASVEPKEIRSLDAIHLATALSIDPLPDAFISYDLRLNAAARAAGLHVETPA